VSVNNPGVLILAAGLVLITPGLLTDTVGFLLLIAPARRVIRDLLIRRFRQHLTVVTPMGRSRGGPAPSGGPPTEGTAGDHEAIDVPGRVIEDG